MSIEERNRIDIVDEVKRRFPDCDVVDEEDGGSEALNVYVNGRNGRVCTLTFPCLEWHDYHEHRSGVLAKIARAASTTGGTA